MRGHRDTARPSPRVAVRSHTCVSGAPWRYDHLYGLHPGGEWVLTVDYGRPTAEHMGRVRTERDSQGPGNNAHHDRRTRPPFRRPTRGETQDSSRRYVILVRRTGIAQTSSDRPSSTGHREDPSHATDGIDSQSLRNRSPPLDHPPDPRTFLFTSNGVGTRRTRRTRARYRVPPPVTPRHRRRLGTDI